MHLGLEVYVLGETRTPRLPDLNGCLLIVFSSSGSTPVVQDLVESVKQSGCRVYLITSSLDSPVGRRADEVIRLIVDPQPDTSPCFAPLNTIFETAAFVFGDALISELMQMKGIATEDMWEKHANLIGLPLIPGGA
jgi:6-phospho-3-hexuloisomerase